MEPTNTYNLRRTPLDLKQPEKAKIQRTLNFDQQGKAYNRASRLVEAQVEKINTKKFIDSNSSGKSKVYSKYSVLTNSSGSI